MPSNHAGSETARLRTWITIDRAAVKNNYQIFRSLIGPKTKLMAVVKSNAYGHGLVGFSQEVAALGVDYLGVDSITEALRLRREGLPTPILVLGYTRPANFAAALEAGVEVTISSLESLAWLLDNQNTFSAGQKLRLHLKVDTGMHRQGFLLNEFPRALELLQKLERVVAVVGVFSHLAAPSEAKFAEATAVQVAEFEKFLTALNEAGFKTAALLKHLCSTGGTFTQTEAHFDLVRVGLGMYGLWPSRELAEKFSKKFNLQPVLSWQTILSELKTVPVDGRIGYDFTEAVKAGTRVGICPIGYWHGFSRALSARGEVAWRSPSGELKISRALGRVSMDMIAIDATPWPEAKVGDEVTLIGEGVPAGRVAELAGTSSYEIVTRLNPLIKKFYR